MLILVAVTVTVALKGGLFKIAKDAAKGTQEERDKELAWSDEKVIDKWLNGVKIKDLEPDKVYYADINNDGAPDGVIYADLARGNVKSGKWTNDDGFYTIPNDLTNPKEYTVSVENYNGPLAKFGEGDVLTVSGNESGNDRFYIMALEDISKNGPSYDWYNAAYGKLDNYGDDQKVFGTGKTNTAKMIEYWNARRTLWRARQVCSS